MVPNTSAKTMRWPSPSVSELSWIVKAAVLVGSKGRPITLVPFDQMGAPLKELGFIVYVPRSLFSKAVGAVLIPLDS